MHIEKQKQKEDTYSEMLQGWILTLTLQLFHEAIEKVNQDPQRIPFTLMVQRSSKIPNSLIKPVVKVPV